MICGLTRLYRVERELHTLDAVIFLPVFRNHQCNFPPMVRLSIYSSQPKSHGGEDWWVSTGASIATSFENIEAQTSSGLWKDLVTHPFNQKTVSNDHVYIEWVTYKMDQTSLTPFLWQRTCKCVKQGWVEAWSGVAGGVARSTFNCHTQENNGAGHASVRGHPPC